ncbi:sulfite exporter TauE/SafE family protein [Paenibacillus sacheonensis]|uniref:Probable membrane transporter protein n=1 Tax=Paenibacillus sacheonensis TaxID=742054 RepID=A0A7X4YUP6_9BACL|nr:sulfite exporter TauE/SafE family protein [Paenibacillus sacheonensis]NBC72793.1 TSUP family transporter [Paenibacillus sacheonensis]
MDLAWIMTLFVIGFLGSFISGMVGIGGSIINYPMLLFIPSALGFTAFTVQEVTAISAVQVFFASFMGMLVFRKRGLVDKTLVVYMGIPIIAGSFLGSFVSNTLPSSVINIVYAILALIASVMMFLPKKGIDAQDVNQVTFKKPLAIALALIIGSVSGIVGAAGAFITVPVMLVVLKIPTRVAIASSLAITFISSIGSTTGKLMGGHTLLLPSLVLIIASTIAAPIGAKISKHINTKILQWILAGLITATVIKIWISLLF